MRGLKDNKQINQRRSSSINQRKQQKERPL
jgi:hypothetical protein